MKIFMRNLGSKILESYYVLTENAKLLFIVVAILIIALVALYTSVDFLHNSDIIISCGILFSLGIIRSILGVFY